MLKDSHSISNAAFPTTVIFGGIVGPGNWLILFFNLSGKVTNNEPSFSVTVNFVKHSCGALMDLPVWGSNVQKWLGHFQNVS